MERVQEIAYYLWENAGRPEGKDLDFWLRAERFYSVRWDCLLSIAYKKAADTQCPQVMPPLLNGVVVVITPNGGQRNFVNQSFADKYLSTVPVPPPQEKMKDFAVPPGDGAIWTMHNYGYVQMPIVLCDYSPVLWDMCFKNTKGCIKRGGYPDTRFGYCR
jgi:hypothetical protein